MEKAIIERIKHIETFYEQAPPGFVKEYEDAPEECIPDTEENRKAREFLANAPTKGLWMPLGKEVKVMQCWKCKNYGHRTGDRECPLFISGNTANEKFREMHEDPMYNIMTDEKKTENKVRWLQQMLEKSSTSESESGSEHKKKKHRKAKRKKKKTAWVEKDTPAAERKKSKSKKDFEKHKHDKKDKKNNELEQEKKRRKKHKHKSRNARSSDSDHETSRKKHKGDHHHR